jgi:hypothetical protein
MWSAYAGVGCDRSWQVPWQRRLQHGGEVTLENRKHVGDGHVAAEFDGQGGDPGIANAAGHDAVVPGHVRVAVEREAVHRHAPRHADADCGDLAFGPRVVGGEPDPAASCDPLRCDSEFGAGTDQEFL